MPLESFTQSETQGYLNKRGITDPAQVALIWHLSQGLPLYLGLLTSHKEVTIDPAADVIANFLRWIPEQEENKRKLVLDAALLSHPFNQDVLAAFPYIAEQERLLLYRWLTTQPFVHTNPFDGRCSYHHLARELFCRHLLQNSPHEYRTTRKSIAGYYQQLLQEQDGFFYVDRAIIYLELRKWQYAVADCNKALELLPDEIVCYVQRAEAYFGIKD